MSGLAEASAIIGLVSTAARLSQIVIEIASQYRDASAQIQSFGREVSILGRILDQFSRLLSKDIARIEIGVHLLTTEIVDECSNMFAELEIFSERLCSKSGARNPTLRAKTKWIFKAAELEYLRVRVDSMKINILLMMTLQTVNTHQGSSSDPRIEEHTKSIQILSTQSEACAKQLEKLEEDMDPTAQDDADEAASLRTFETAHSVQTTRESILGLYAHTPYAKKLWSTSNSSFITTHEEQDSHLKVLEIVEEHLSHLKTLPDSNRDVGRESVVENRGLGDDDENFRNTQCVLSLDGGGVRTYSSILILQQLMAEIASVESNMAQKEIEFPPKPLAAKGRRVPTASSHAASLNVHPWQYFDYIAGASTGGIVAIMLGRLGMSVHRCIMEFRTILESMFGSPRFASIRSPLFWPRPKYGHHPFESEFENVLRRYDMNFMDANTQGVLFESDPLKCKTIAVAWLRDPIAKNGRPYLFRSYDQYRWKEDSPFRIPAKDLQLGEIARALTSTPGYFSPMRIGSSEFIGSEKELNNASLAVLEEVVGRIDPSDEVDISFVSIGSGNSGRSRVGGFLSTSSAEAHSREDPVHKTKRNIRHTYHRLNPGRLLASIKLDEWQKSKANDEVVTIDRITNATMEYLSDIQVQESLRKIAGLLVRKRRAFAENDNSMRCFASALIK